MGLVRNQIYDLTGTLEKSHIPASMDHSLNLGSKRTKAFSTSPQSLTSYTASSHPKFLALSNLKLSLIKEVSSRWLDVTRITTPNSAQNNA